MGVDDAAACLPIWTESTLAGFLEVSRVTVNPAIPASEIVRAWGSFTPDTLNVIDVARNEAAYQEKLAAQAVAR